MKTILVIIILGALLFTFMPLSGFTRAAPIGLRATVAVKELYNANVAKIAEEGIAYKTLDELLAAHPYIKIPEDAIIEFKPESTTQTNHSSGIFLRLHHKGYRIEMLNDGEVRKTKQQ